MSKKRKKINEANQDLLIVTKIDLVFIIQELNLLKNVRKILMKERMWFAKDI